MNRRSFVAGLGAATALAQQQERKPPFETRGYYYTFGRMPTLGLPEWKQIIDGIAVDRGNLVLLWIGGGFRSKKFPITWQYNLDHRNIQKDFVRELIDYAHTRGIRILLGFTPFSYDGVNQYSVQHPRLKAMQSNGNYVKLGGIHCWGYALNPSEPQAQQFMLDYVRELYFEFYPNADGLLIESSDYAICECPACAGRYYELEYSFVRRISEEVWKHNASATVIVYPHYFTGAKVPGFRTPAARLDFDDRYTLFFTPHSALIDDALLSKARGAIYWDPCTACGIPEETKEAATKAANHRIPGFVTSNESFTYVIDHVEWDNRERGRRMKPFGFDWIADGVNPYEDPIVSVNRVAYRIFSASPSATMAEFEAALSQVLESAAVKEMLQVHACCYENRSWGSASPLFHPTIFREALERGRLNRPKLQRMLTRLRDLESAADRLSRAPGSAARRCAAVAHAILKSWDKPSRDLLAGHLT